MEKEDHIKLYSEISSVLFNRTKSIDELTPAQNFFIKAFESAAFGTDLLECYSDLINEYPDIQVRNLHAFCVGHSLGVRMGTQITEENKTAH